MIKKTLKYFTLNGQDMEEQTRDLLKPTGTVQIGNKFSLIERKLLNTIIWNSQRKNNFSSEEERITIREVFELIGMPKSKNEDAIKDALRVLAGTIIEWNYFAEDKSAAWKVCTFLASGGLEKGYVTYRLNPEIVHHINRPTLFAKIKLLIQTKFKKRDSLVLYEFLVDFLSRQKVDNLVLEDIPLDKITKLLGIDEEDSTYASFKFFNRDILKPSIQEINKQTDIDVSCKPIKKQRWVTGITFYVKRKDSFQLFLPLQQEAPDNALVDLLIVKGIAPKKAAELVRDYDKERITENLALVAKAREEGKIKNAAAYLVKAIEEDYRPKLTPEEHAKAEKAEKQRQEFATKEKAKAEQQSLQAEYEKFRYERVTLAMTKKTTEWLNEKKHALLKSANSVVRNSYKKSGDSSPVVANFLKTALIAELLTSPEELSFESYLMWKQGSRVG